MPTATFKPRKPSREATSAANARYYGEGDEERLNISAICKDYGVNYWTVIDRQKRGKWPGRDSALPAEIRYWGRPGEEPHRPEETFLRSEVEAALRPPASAERVKSRCGTIEGSWAGPVFVSTEGLAWGPIGYLGEKYGKYVAAVEWYWWVEHRCPDLPQRANGGRIHSVEVPGPHGGWVRVWRLDDAVMIYTRRKDRAARLSDPDGIGRWLPNGTFQLARDMGPDDPPHAAGLRAGDVLAPDGHLARQAGMTSLAPVRWRRRPQSGLDPSVNGGRLRYLEVCRPARGRRTSIVPVSSVEDGLRIIQNRGAVRQARPNGGDGATAKQLARQLGIDPANKDRCRDLRKVLQRFRAEVPDGARLVEARDEHRDRYHREYRYDAPRFRAWLGGRKISDLAAELRRLPPSGAAGQRRLWWATVFLYFVLTHKSYSARLFNRFVANPPYGEELAPSGPVPVEDIERLAKGAKRAKRPRFSRILLRRAKKAAGVRHVRKGRGPDCKVYWYLPGPVVIPTPAPGEGGRPEVAPSDAPPPGPPLAEERTPPVDGPCPPDGLRIGGTLYGGFSALECRLIECLWGKQFVEIDAVLEYVYGHDADDKDGALGSLSKNLNRKFRRSGCTAFVREKRGFLSLLPGGRAGSSRH